jgi:hypothetical protein
VQFTLGSIARIIFTSILGSVAFDIGWYGVNNPILIVGLLIFTAAAMVAGFVLINRWQTTGYKRISERVTIPTGTARPAGTTAAVARPASPARPDAAAGARTAPNPAGARTTGIENRPT